MRILVLSRSAWRNDNSTGRTLTDIMSAFPDAEIYGLSMREQPPQNNIIKDNFIISETQMIKGLFKKNYVGAKSRIETADEKLESNVYGNSNAKSRISLWIAREMLWNIGGWKNQKLRSYIQEVDPDIIFSPVFPGCYPQKLLLYVQKISKAKVVVFHTDDNYTLKRVMFSPIAWIYRFVKRKWVKKTALCADINYVISDIQKEDYEKAFRRECKILTKSADFLGDAPVKQGYNTPLQLVFTGNIGLNRWRSLQIIADALEKINADGIKAQMRIYTATPLTEKMERALNRGESSHIMGKVSADEVAKIQNDADMLIHVEAFDLKNRLTVRQSFSTKIVDYLKAARPILAVGPVDVASIDHLVRNDCAIVAQNEKEIIQKLESIIENPSILTETAVKGYECGRRFHNKSDIQKMLIDDMNSILIEQAD